MLKVDFFWINRSQDAFEWFVDMLREIDQAQERYATLEKMIDFHIYLTGAKRQNNMKSLFLTMALDAFRHEEGKDALTGLRTRTHAGRPDWGEVFERLFGVRRYEKTTVFYCGPKRLGNRLQQLCQQYGLTFRSEKF